MITKEQLDQIKSEVDLQKYINTKQGGKKTKEQLREELHEALKN